MMKRLKNKLNTVLLNNDFYCTTCLELRKMTKNYDLIKIRFRKVRLKRKMIGINERSAPQILTIIR